jgi:uncharacterized membrane-anchored protein YitT (DUF2179 family)
VPAFANTSTLCATGQQLKMRTKDFNIVNFIIATVIVGILLVLSLIAAAAEDEGTLGTNIFLRGLAKLFYVLRFPTHSLMGNIFSDRATKYFAGLFINCVFYALVIERITSLRKSTNV